MGWSYSNFTPSSKCCLPKYLQSANCILVEEWDGHIQFLQHLQNVVSPNIFNPQIVYLLKNRDGHIQFLQHLQNVVSPNIFNPQIVYLLKNGMGIFNFYN